MLVSVLGASLLVLPFSQSSSAAPVKEVRRILVFNDFDDIASPGVALLDQAVLGALENSPYQIEWYSETLEATLFSDSASQHQIREWFIQKYQHRKPDAIVTVGPASLKFMVEAHERSFPNIPIIFCGSTEEMVDQPKPDSHFTGVWGVPDPKGTLEAALQLQPRTEHVVVVGGTGEFDRRVEAVVRNALHSYESQFEFTYLTDLDMPTLRQRLSALSRNTIVFHTSIMQDAAGSHFVDASQSVPMVASAANAPVFVVDDVDLRDGTVGGDLVSWAADGKAAAGLVVRVLHGEKPGDIPTVKDAPTYMFDWRALKRWGLEERNLPPGSIVLNRQLTVWESYKWYVVAGTSLMFAEALLILALLWNRSQRRKAENELAITYDRLRLGVEAGRCVGWDWDVKSGKNRWFGDLQAMFGIPSETCVGGIEDFWRHVYAGDRQHVSNAIADARENRKRYTAEFRVIRDDQSVRWITARGQFYYAGNGHPVRMLGMAVDITERKLAEEALASLSGYLIEAQEEERKRIAREIHDDYQQRLTIVAVELEELAEDTGKPTVDVGKRLRELWQRVSELGADLHTLSHTLHSSTLQTLGLVAGVRAYCEEFSDQHGLRIDFMHENVPGDIDADVTLCLFRVTQEALRNIKRHSGADRAEVRLEARNQSLHLSVSDRGSGFDPSIHSRETGIGIESMRERLRLVGGTLAIHSRSSEGTSIEVSVPIKVASRLVG